MTLRLSTRSERWPIAGGFTISRGTKTEAAVVVAEISDGSFTGRGEAVPYARYGETVKGVIEEIVAMVPVVQGGITRLELLEAMSAGAARCAIDCALWDLEAKRAGKRAWDLAGLAPVVPLTTALTISLGTPEQMAAATAAARDWPLLKIKLGGKGDPERIRAVRAAAPDANLIIDANEGWHLSDYEENMAACEEASVALIEQPFPAEHDAALADLPHPVPVCADESLHTRAELDRLARYYDAVNIKLDKTGGLTEALLLAEEARARNLKIMVGCMLATSLAMAPAFVLAQGVDFVDLDGPLLLAKDRDPCLVFDDSRILPPDPALWG